MKKSLRITLVWLVVVASLLIFISQAIAITWGDPDTEHTNVGAMMVDWPGYGWLPVCSGTLIHPRVFLTAGHCTYGAEDRFGIGNIKVTFDDDAADSPTLLEVQEIIPHPKYNRSRSNPHDVGVLILASPKDDIGVVTLPPEGLLDDLKKAGMLRQGWDEADFTVVGYGGTLSWPPPDVTYGDFRQQAESEYQALTKSWLRLSQLLATGDGGTCYGDSGGPAFWVDPDTGIEILVGITSWGDNQCVATGFNYRVDTSDTLDFIEDVIADLD